MKKLNINHLEALDYNGNEALNTICSNLSFAGRDLKKVIITSSTAGNGKSYLAMQIAYNLARRGKAVLLIDCDLRRSVMVSRYDIRTPDNSELKGIAHYLAGYADLNDVVYETNMQNLYFLPVGRDVANPVPLIVAGAGELKLRPGRLCDLCPTMLDLMGLEKPAEMTGVSLIRH